MFGKGTFSTVIVWRKTEKMIKTDAENSAESEGENRVSYSTGIVCLSYAGSFSNGLPVVFTE